MNLEQEIKLSDKQASVLHLLWTGGWDSTFRLLQLLFQEEKFVKPYYVIRPQPSTGKEIDTIHNIRRNISRNYPKAAQLIRPVEYINVDNIKPDPKIKQAYDSIKKSAYIAPQYEMFARYCKQNGLENLEIGIEKGTRSHQLIEDFVKESEVSKFKVDRNLAPQPFYDLFKYFNFPLLKYTKLDMEAVAREQGWLELMKMTWFCRRPKNGHPCGFCGPCTDVVIDGLGWRLPVRARIIANIQLPFRKWWRNNYQKQNEGVFKQVPKLFRGRF
ncbi:MAG TPA: hypothetical protein VE868_00890 [Balneolaceae bacterium]|nr:hypothetical protein [Balneolaceae bacterium]